MYTLMEFENRQLEVFISCSEYLFHYLYSFPENNEIYQQLYVNFHCK